MARIPDEELARIKSQVTVEDLCRDYGIELTRMGPDNLTKNGVSSFFFSSTLLL